MNTLMIDHKKLWEETLSHIELDVSKANFITWFKNTSIHKFDSGVVYLAVPNAFVRDWLQNKYHSSILKALRENMENVRCIEYIIHRGTPVEGHVETRSQEVSQQPELGELYVDKEDNLNPKYTFENFVVGSFNELAYAASQAVIKNPGISYNPLFIYGGTGLGKTHLIQSIGNYFKKVDKDKKIHYLSAEKFTIECVNAIRNNKAHIFKDKYRKYDVLIMDDIQFLSGKDKTQEEVFHLFNTLYDNNKQIIFSADKAPKQILGIEERLKSRFEGGMIADIGSPEYESRLAILKAKALSHNISAPEEVIEYVASVVQNNIRELEGVLNLVAVQTGLKKRDLTIGEVKILIKNNIKPQKSISINDVIKTIANFYNIDEKELYQKTRKKEVVKPRQVVMYLLREDFNTSYPYIGQKMGGRDHTTVIHAYEKIKGDLARDNLLSQELEQIKTILYGTA
ncbi:MAG TPA: chromosomal replication initiator protein DnaA [Candidatus Paceibacterota bacterium]